MIWSRREYGIFLIVTDGIRYNKFPNFVPKQNYVKYNLYGYRRLKIGDSSSKITKRGTI